MTVFVVGAAKGAPGATTSVIALGGVWPDWREPFLVSADPGGCDVVIRLAALEGDDRALARTPCTVQLAAATGNLAAQDLFEYSQRLPGPGEVRVLVGPGAAFSAATALTQLISAGLVRELLALDGFDVLVDVGRLDHSSPALALVRGVGTVILVARTTVESLDHTRDLVAGLALLGIRSQLLLIGDPRLAVEAGEVVGAPVVGVLPDDPDAASVLAGTSLVRRRIERSRLVKAAARIAVDLAGPPPQSAESGVTHPSRRRRAARRSPVSAGAAPLDGDGSAGPEMEGSPWP